MGGFRSRRSKINFDHKRLGGNPIAANFHDMNADGNRIIPEHGEYATILDYHITINI